jgi:hypothetical protein
MKRPGNVSITTDAIASRVGPSPLADDPVRGLPSESKRERERSPIVQRLRGVAAGGKTDREDYRRHLQGKYVGR